MEKSYLAWRIFQERFLKHVAALCLLGPALLAVVEVVRRYGFGVSFPWQQDAVTYIILSGVFLYFAIAQRRKAHLRVTIFLILLRDKGGRGGAVIAGALEVLGAAVGLLFCGYLVWRGLEAAQLMVSQNRMTESLVFPLWLFFIIFLVSIGLMAVSFFFQLYQEVQALRGKEVLVEKMAAEEESGPVL